MKKLYPGLYATPFHVRTAAQNVYNAWAERGMFTVPRHFGNVTREALAARFSVILADVSSWGRLRVHGAGAERLLSSATKSDLGTLPAGESLDVFWTADGGGVRGTGVVSRFGEENFLLEACNTDKEWFLNAASRFGAKLRDEQAEKGVLLVAGPYAAAVLEAVGLSTAAKLSPRSHAIYEWEGTSVTVARRPVLGGFELSCARDDALVLFDRLFSAGRPFALTLIGQDALELLYLEAGMPLCGIDYVPARSATDKGPVPAALGLAPSSGGANVLAGLEWDGANLGLSAPVHSGAMQVGHTMRSADSPALRRTIALANLSPEHAVAGTELMVGDSGSTSVAPIAARVVPLPFLPL